MAWVACWKSSPVTDMAKDRKELEERSLMLMGNLRERGLLFAAKWFYERDYLVLDINQIKQQVNILAKNPKNGNNESFHIEGSSLIKMVFVNRRGQTWAFERVYTCMHDEPKTK